MEVLADVKLMFSRTIVPQMICLTLVLLLIWQIVSGLTNFFSLDKALSVRHDSSTGAKINAKPSSLNEGLKTAFFGDYVPKNLSESDVKQSMLNLKVVGIMFADSEAASHVIIRTANGNEQTFGVGDSLPGGATIKRITSDGVLIGRNGSLERLSLPKNALIFEPLPKPLESEE